MNIKMTEIIEENEEQIKNLEGLKSLIENSRIDSYLKTKLTKELTTEIIWLEDINNDERAST